MKCHDTSENMSWDVDRCKHWNVVSAFETFHRAFYTNVRAFWKILKHFQTLQNSIFLNWVEFWSASLLLCIFVRSTPWDPLVLRYPTLEAGGRAEKAEHFLSWSWVESPSPEMEWKSDETLHPPGGCYCCSFIFPPPPKSPQPLVLPPHAGWFVTL